MWCRMFAVLGLLYFTQGCVSSRYFADRGNDALDIITCTAGVGLGAKARIGPVQLGLLVNRDIAGVRGGLLLWRSNFGNDMLFSEYDFLLLSGDFFFDKDSDLRQKYYSAGGGLLIKEVCPSANQRIRGRPYYYTQIEVVGAGLGSLRLGVNPGEMVDFLLGWFGIDIFSDDIGRLPSVSQGSSVGSPNSAIISTH